MQPYPLEAYGELATAMPQVLFSAQTIEERVRELTGAPSGFAGPVGLSVRTIADHSVRRIRSGATA